MTFQSFLAAAPTRLDPLQLFLDADIVVQAVIVGLVIASIWSWAIIVSFWLRMAGVKRRANSFEADFMEAEDPHSLLGEKNRRTNASARVAAAGIAELRASSDKGRVRDKAGAAQRVSMAMEGQVAEEADNLSARLNFLATTGSVAPFVGLFGTVWGIMNSFFQIGAQENSSLAVVAPGISEALFATAIGLFAAIPAVIAYNRFSARVNAFEARLHRFADRVSGQIGRELEGG
ncbi:protein TolQ [Paraurantiacibacter namhicola]|uniref:Biopolymer transport protein ExbB n=1 Tax=Paraurantiacibacter namhicola TaxID=645517 RepID=A0A1C7D7K2_9SPHN|nr:protein TolQ [Paraurantiacibacter namhicola]ANU07301.1 Biopolymer transport protein ExbB [Paraurantiacibacter namhicola]